MNKLVYLDNAATTFPKPPQVLREVQRCLEKTCGNPGRGGNPLAMAAADQIYECRDTLASFFSAPDPSHVVLCANCTAALNLAIKGLVRCGDHILVSDLEHNSVRRPLERLRAEGIADYSAFSLLHFREKELESLLRPETRLLVCTAASNICSVTAPLRRLGDFCRRRGLLFVVDGAQAGGHSEIRMDRMNISALALPSHKGMFGIQGGGALLLADGILPTPLWEGGSGSLSLDPGMPEDPPERYEAGTLATPAAVSLTAGIHFVREQGLDAIASHERKLFFGCRERLESVRGVSVCAREYPGSVLSFRLSGIPADRAANELGRRSICVRGGYHCAPWAHHALGTDGSGSDASVGTVRVSFSLFNTEEDLDALWLAVREIAAGK